MSAVTSELSEVSDLCVSRVPDDVITEDSSFSGDYDKQDNVVCFHIEVNSEKVFVFPCKLFA